MRSPQSRPPQSTKMPGFFASPLCLLIRRANGFPRNGPCVRSQISPRRSEWERPLPMPGAMLFTLVGIAGEDDLDAPDLDATSKTEVVGPSRSDHRSQATGDTAVAARGRDGGAPVLTSEQSAVLRDRLLNQLAAIGSADEAASWAQRNLPAKNTLTATDAKVVEERFRDRISTI